MAAGAKRCVWGWLLATIAVIGGCTSETLEYNGTVTLADYPNPKTLESELAKDVLLEAIGFWKEDKDTQSVSAAHMMEITAFLYLGLHTNWVHDVDARSMNIRPTGPFIGDVGYNTHQRARIYYSNGIVDWLLNDRQGEIPDGSMLVKQMYPTDPNNTSYGGDKVTGWAVMIRDSKSSADGWFWFLFFFPGTPSYGSPVLLSQYGMSFCLSCHAGADNDMHTFSTINNINGKNPSQYTSIHNPPSINAQNAAQLISNGHLTMPNTFDLHLEDVESLLAKVDDHRDTHPKDLADKVGKHLGDMPKELIKMMGGGSMAELMMKPVTPPLTAPNPAIVKAFGKSPVNKKELVVLPWDLTTGHVGVDGVDPEQFVTSDNCRGCHDASLLLGGLQPSMMWYEDTGDPDVPHNKYNLAVFGEWGTSMMGLAGRDPIFHAQLEAEQALRP
ncbi:MAG: cytochrome P460 family protein, partial [Pseudomonadota bacterium]